MAYLAQFANLFKSEGGDIDKYDSGGAMKEIPHKCIRRKPTVSFIDVNREFAIRSRSSESASDIGDDHEGNSNPDLDADDEDITDSEDNLIQPILDGLVMLNLDADSDININSEFLSQYLTESGPQPRTLKRQQWQLLVMRILWTKMPTGILTKLINFLVTS
ncbi:hypothetical protein F5887DRAFT_1084412 [Amanita rubescens]|nr:hypothetical protein F5887DRAFT_1084412 [Amanita rubescens]